ncbi:MAG: hypothetical protein GY749_36270 [Desulfobacteraceae bacterium]|nr:hypothetical protein [Desulfobacteraceae bacterium]
MGNIEIVTSDFVHFLITAKRNTWAGDGEQIRHSDYSKNCSYSDGVFEYKDQYFGNLVDGGREVVFFNKRPIWIMGYHGGVFEEYYKHSEEIFTFLCRSLLASQTGLPVRGPRCFVEGDFEYQNSYQGDLKYFTGSEIIVWRKIKVYRKAYVGGEIRDRRYPVTFI